jgi:hypothetical protein
MANIGQSQAVLKSLAGLKSRASQMIGNARPSLKRIARPVAAGAALAGGANLVGSGLRKSDEFEAGFYPGYGSVQG